MGRIRQRIPLPDLAISLALILSILLVYAQVVQFSFVNFDDDLYVYSNPIVASGLTLAGIKWAFTAVVAGNWQPVTLLSHMRDVQLFGLRSEMHHLVNVVLHALSAVLLYLALHRATRQRAPSAFVAFVFALHPLHVESVAWVAERKDVLGAFFCFLALYAYVRYTESPSVRRYLPVLGLFTLGLMSKPMMVTFPFMLLLLDFWPLDRFRSARSRWALVWEKLPLLALSAAASIATYLVQRSSGAIIAASPLDTRIVKALLSYVTYIRQMFWPTRLAVFYPHPAKLLASQAALCLVFLALISALVVSLRRTRPYLAMGWFWYLGTLVPVIGLVRIGQHSHADRYTYIPLAGLSIMLAWFATDIIARWPRTKPAVALTAALACAACLVLAARQVTYWRNSETLFQHAIDVTAGNWLAHGNLGQHLMDIPDRRADAVDHLETALRLRPGYGEAHANLGICLARAGLFQAAIPHFEAALLAKPSSVPLHVALAVALSTVPARRLEAVDHYQTALRLQPDYPEARRGLGDLLVLLGRSAEALPHLEAALRIHPDPETARTIEQLRSQQVH